MHGCGAAAKMLINGKPFVRTAFRAVQLLEGRHVSGFFPLQLPDLTGSLVELHSEPFGNFRLLRTNCVHNDCVQ